MINIAILGFGVVGSGVAEVVSMNAHKISRHLGEDLQVKHILDLREFPDSEFGSLVTHNADDVFEDPEISIVVETIGGARIAYEYTKRALNAGKSVVTSNKELVATHGVELMNIAEEHNCCYLYEAAVGGGIPIIRPLHRCLAANRIERIAGIVNGTTNYILTSMRDKGISYDEALKQAQANGYAEQNPSADVDGIDAQRKLSILSSIALEGLYVSPEEINTTGISEITLDDINFATKIGGAMKLLAVLDNTKGKKPSVFVAPHIVMNSSMLSSVDDVFNAIMVEGNALGESMFYGKGAGKLPTASAVAGDILEAAMTKGRDTAFRKWHVSENEEKVTSEFDEVVTNIVVRVSKNDSEALNNKLAAVSDKISIVDADESSAMFIYGISHADIKANISSDIKWFHLME